MESTILRGDNQIGGSVVEITTDAGKRIWVDFGSELSVKEEFSTDRMLIDRMRNEATRPHAVFFTHIHGDHIGLLAYVEKGVKVYIGPVAIEMLKNIREALIGVEKDVEKRALLKREQDILSGDTTVKYENKQRVYDSELGIWYTALRVDHSVFDSYMLKFEIDGEVLVHTGDFRSHGRLGDELLSDVRKHMAGKVDKLIIEGTMMTRLNETVMTEDEMQKKAKEIFSKNKYAFLMCSSTNVDSLASFHNAMKNVDKDRKLFCTDYVYSQLQIYTELIGKKENREEYIFSNIERFPRRKGELTKEMKDHGFVMLVGKRHSYRERIRALSDLNPTLIYSMWEGYLEEDKEYTDKDIIRTVSCVGPNVNMLHTSGHATAKTLTEIINIIDAKTICPIHTENPFGFYMLDITNEMRNRICIDIDKINEAREEEIVDCRDLLKVREYDFSTGEKDCRAIIEKFPALWKELSEGGVLHPIIQLVKGDDDLELERDDELELCFRGNDSSSEKRVTVYYNNHEFFSVGIVNKKGRISFNKSHARYWKTEDEANDILSTQYGFVLNHSTDRYVKNFDVISLDELKRIRDMRKEIMETYFSLSHVYDYFKNEKLEKPLDKLELEKYEQQRLMSSNTECKNGYYIYDMEYAQPFFNSDVKNFYKLITGGLKQNKPDSLAIRFDEKGVPKALVFIELKSTESAMKGKSSIYNHIIGMKNYVNNPLNRPFIAHRKKEAYEIMRSYKALGIHNCDVTDFKMSDFEALDIELLVVITDNTPENVLSAKSYYDIPENMDKIKKTANMGSVKCGILLLEKDNFKLDFNKIIYE